MKNYSKTKSTILSLLGIFAITLTSCNEDLGMGPEVPQYSTENYNTDALNSEAQQIDVYNLPYEELADLEVASLIFMREEEKLARDIYIEFFEIYPDAQIFSRISDSEQKHMDAVLALLDKYGIEDPVVDEGAIGIFANTDLQSLYNSLLSQGEESLIEALTVGATIEEIDIIDLMALLENTVDNEDITLVYSNLLKGSRNHLRMFVQNLSVNGVTYEPTYLDVTLFDSIISSDMEKGLMKQEKRQDGNTGKGVHNGNNGNNGNGGGNGGGN